ncbi:MAG: helix-turn-helix domain-containing protein [Synechococcus sp. SB0667_bin_8]|nr:excisionase family DNA-binding protein [Cyanobacteria bacterium MAG IRC4_bin_6]MXX09250.1 helix-turn-helix domain-containing protein [Synechococcus sp. SB0667_bin_8]
MDSALPCPPTVSPGSIPQDQLEQLAALLPADNSLEGPRLVGPRNEVHSVPEPLYGLMRTLLEHLKCGEAVTLIPRHAVLTTQQAAQILNVSRAYLNRLLDQETIPCEMVGRHRRLRLGDVLQLKEQQYQQRCDALDQLCALSQEIEESTA